MREQCETLAGAPVLVGQTVSGARALLEVLSVKDIKVGWALVNYGPIFSPVYGSHLRAIAKASRTLTVQQVGAIGAAGASDRMYVHSAEIRVVEEALAAGCTHVFMTESDMVLPDETIMDLLAVDKPVVSGVYFLRSGYGQPCLYKRTLRMVAEKVRGMSPVTVFPMDRPFRLNGCPGFGCVLMQADIFTKLPRPWFDLKENSATAPGYGSDIYFYSQCEDYGIEVWVQPKVLCGQLEYVEWDVGDYQMRLKEDPGFAANGFIIGAQHA